MNLRSKTLIVIAVSFLTFIPTIYFFSEKILITGAEKLEKEEAYNEMERITAYYMMRFIPWMKQTMIGLHGTTHTNS